MKQQVTVLPVDLARWDHARPGDLLAVPVFSDMRPLRGAAGLLDWRMCGRLSGFLASGKLSGAEGEQMLFPSGNRLPWRFVLAFGAGSSADFSEKRLRALVRRTLKTLRGLKVSRIALALPGSEGRHQAATAEASEPAAAAAPSASAAATAAASTSSSARRALDLALGEIEAQPGAVVELTVIAPLAAQKELAEALRLRAVRS